MDRTNLLKIICLDKVYQYKVDFEEELPLGYFVSECLRMKLLSGNHQHDTTKYNGRTFTGIIDDQLGKLSFSTILTKEFYKSISKLIMLFEGPLKFLNSTNLLIIASYVGYSARDISSLQMVNRRFNSIFKTDSIWQHVILSNIYCGMGNTGDEDYEWEYYKEHYGLPYFNVLRLIEKPLPFIYIIYQYNFKYILTFFKYQNSLDITQYQSTENIIWNSSNTS
jgi:hypothetical protein